LVFPWVINNSDSSDVVPQLNDKNVGNYQSITCKYSLFEFLLQNTNSSYFINLDKPASIDCFSKINGADNINEKLVVYLGTNLNIDLIVQVSFWLILFSFIPKHEKYFLKNKNISILFSLVLILLHYISENTFYSYNSKIFSTNLEENFQIYSIILTFFIFLKLFSQMIESRVKNVLYFLPFLFVFYGSFNSTNLNIVYISLMFIGISTLFKYSKNRFVLIFYIGAIYFWISSIKNTITFFDVDKLKGFTSSAYNSNSLIFWSLSFLFFVYGFLYICEISIREIDLFKVRFNFLLSGCLVFFLSVISALNPVINFFTYYYLGLNKTASKSFESVAGNAWRGINPSAESIGEFFAFVILFTLLVAIYKKNFSLSKYEVVLLLVNFFGLIRSNNFAALISLIIFGFLLFFLVYIKSQKIKYSLIFFLFIFFPVVYLLFFNTYSFEESSTKLLKESFVISNIEELKNNQYNQNPIYEDRFYEVIINEEVSKNISTSLNYLVNKYHFSERNNIPNITTLISAVAAPINRSEKWGIFFGKYNPSLSTFLFGTGPNNIVNYYFGHASKVNDGLILPHSSLLSFMIFFGIFGIVSFSVWCFIKLFNNRSNPYYLILVFYFLTNLIKSDSLLYLNSFLLFLFVLNLNNIFIYNEEN